MKNRANQLSKSKHFFGVVSVVVTYLFVLIAMFPERAFAKNDNKPFYLVYGESAGLEFYNFELTFTDSNGVKREIKSSLQSIQAVTAEAVARSLGRALNKNKEVNDEYQFDVYQGNNGAWYVVGTAKAGMKPKPLKGGVKLADSSGFDTLVLAGGIDPEGGLATFDVSGTPAGGDVTIGVAGFFVSTPTLYENGDKKTPQVIKSELQHALEELGFSSVQIDPASGEIAVQGVSSGDPDNDDFGALIITTDPGVGVSGAMLAALFELPGPTRGKVSLSPKSGSTGTKVTATVSGFPPNSNLQIVWPDGTVVGTVLTGADGTGSGTFIVPIAAKGEKIIEVSGGSPKKYGYEPFYVTD